ncbi:MAG: hypothetical protein HZA03_03440 [Nitrospinae bacterium]|nr:hypothetical protein [Nitrospinota bacterium]
MNEMIPHFPAAPKGSGAGVVAQPQIKSAIRKNCHSRESGNPESFKEKTLGAGSSSA